MGWLLPRLRNWFPNAINHIGKIGGSTTHGSLCVVTWVFCVEFKEHFQWTIDRKTGDLFRYRQWSLPSTQARQRLNWFSIVNLGSVGKENVRSLMLLLQRPGSSFKIFPAQKTRANKGGQHSLFLPFSLVVLHWGKKNPLEPRTLLLRFTPSWVTSWSVLLLSARRCIAFCSGQLFCLCCFSHMV